MSALLAGRRGCPPAVVVRICATTVVTRPRWARSGSHPLLLSFNLTACAGGSDNNKTHMPQQQQQQPPITTSRRVYQTFSDCGAFNDRLNRFSLQQSPPSRATATITTTMGHSHTQKRGHAGHHHHHHDNSLLISTDKSNPGVRITRIGLYSNLGMAIAKGAGGYLFNSQSMIADAWHSLTDLASDILTLATVSWSLKPPTANFPLGFGKVESLGSLGVSSMLLFGGIFMCTSSSQALYSHLFLDPSVIAEMASHEHSHGLFGHSHSHSHSHGAGVTPSLQAAWLAAGTVAIKEWLYHATMKVARTTKSSVLASNAVHHRVDSLTGIVTLLAILGANFLQNASWLDPVGGLLISLLVIRAGFTNTLSALYELADKSIDEEVRGSVRKHVLSSISTEEVECVDVTGTKSGQNYLVDVELAVPATWTVEQVTEMEDKIRGEVGKNVRGVRRVRVRFSPKGREFSDTFIAADVASRRLTPQLHDHDHDHEHGHGHKKEI
ncbi:cation efflux family-domain-containing protein [Podospora australis]|uniref:Cation efflux family-domain-containing protein n=1 Tax=Podospora australis TaxID=1536484 RepID=A0AAN6X4E6_9PEZI|nr:cation efflux family-domain-containing protein [Podospora australis]